MTTISKHLIFDLYGCETDCINDIAYIEKIVKEVSTLVGLKILYSLVFHKSSEGIIATMIVAEGYFGIQSWDNYISIDIHSDIDIDSEKILGFLVRKFGATKYSASELKRGEKVGVENENN